MRILPSVTCLLSIAVQHFHCEFVGKIVGGKDGSIETFPHSVFLFIQSDDEAWSCGGSVINQRILLTAAHCSVQCTTETCKIYAYFGNAKRKYGILHSVVDYYVHENYDISRIQNDICLMALDSPINLNHVVKRVSIMKNPPEQEMGVVAGWGLEDELHKTVAPRLRFTKQIIWSRNKCIDVLELLPRNTFCGFGPKESYASNGDSGSALTIRGFIQIGLVSYKNPHKSRTLVVYTDVSKFHGWIRAHTRYLYCKNTGR